MRQEAMLPASRDSLGLIRPFGHVTGRTDRLEWIIGEKSAGYNLFLAVDPATA